MFSVFFWLPIAASSKSMLNSISSVSCGTSRAIASPRRTSTGLRMRIAFTGASELRIPLDRMPRTKTEALPSMIGTSGPATSTSAL